MKTKKALGGLLGLLGSLAAFNFLGFLLARSDPFFAESLEKTKHRSTTRSQKDFLTPKTPIDPPAKAERTRRDPHLLSAFLEASAFDFTRFMERPTTEAIRSVINNPKNSRVTRKNSSP